MKLAKPFGCRLNDAIILQQIVEIANKKSILFTLLENCLLKL